MGKLEGPRRAAATSSLAMPTDFKRIPGVSPAAWREGGDVSSLDLCYDRATTAGSTARSFRSNNQVTGEP
jgi:hypothetical protein